MEAEIDSTDRVVPNMTELFGEALLRRRFTHLEAILPTSRTRRSITLPPPSTANNNNTTTTVPGAVPPTTSISTKNSQIKKRQQKLTTNQQQSLSRMVRIVDYGPTIENRTNSMMSHTTFVLDNDKRKPLLVPSGFQEGILLTKLYLFDI